MVFDLPKLKHILHPRLLVFLNCRNRSETFSTRFSWTRRWSWEKNHQTILIFSCRKIFWKKFGIFLKIISISLGILRFSLTRYYENLKIPGNWNYLNFFQNRFSFPVVILLEEKYNYVTACSFREELHGRIGRKPAENRLRAHVTRLLAAAVVADLRPRAPPAGDRLYRSLSPGGKTEQEHVRVRVCVCVCTCACTRIFTWCMRTRCV